MVYLNLCNGSFSPDYINRHYGITQDPITKDYIIIVNYCESGDLKSYLKENFYNLEWWQKLEVLNKIIKGLDHIHRQKVIHRDFHSGNIFCCKDKVLIGDLGLSKSSIKSTNDDDNEIYGIIPYMAPEIFQR